MAKPADMVDLQSLVYDPCGQTERGEEEMIELETLIIWYGNKVRFEELEKLGYKPKKIIHNKNATIVLWNDGTKTVIKGQGDDLFAAFCICFAKKCCNGSTVLNQLFYCTEVKNDKAKVSKIKASGNRVTV